MLNETEIKTAGIRALVAALGDVEAEKFITLILRTPFDYTRWQQTLWLKESVEDISRSAMQLRQTSAT